MQLTEQHIIKSFEWREWCVKAKNLYNQSLYYWRQSMFKNIEYFSEYELLKLFREYKEENFVQLPSHCGQEILKNLFKNIKSWQKARKEYEKNPNKFLGRPKMPNYKKDLSILGFNNMQIKWKDGYIYFPKMIGIDPIKTKIAKDSKLGSCRVIPKANHFVVEFVYEVKEIEPLIMNGNVMGVDIGLNNFATCLTNTGESFIVNGKPLKSINQLYNKRRADLKSKLPLLPKKVKTKEGKRIQVGKSKAIQGITKKRNQQVKNYIHHASKLIIEKAKMLNVPHVIVGNNKNIKQDINLGKRTNQNFVAIPYRQLIEQLQYKAKLNGIKITLTEESYTSKCSFIDFEPLKKHENYFGKRTKRGLFRSKNNIYYNADCNGAGNIIRKVIGDAELSLTESIVRSLVEPKKLLLLKQKVA
jgi:putative transposase